MSIQHPTADEIYVADHIGELAEAAESHGKTVVLVHSQKPVGFFDSELEAARSGLGRFGREPFIIRSVAGSQQISSVASNFQI